MFRESWRIVDISETPVPGEFEIELRTKNNFTLKQRDLEERLVTAMAQTNLLVIRDGRDPFHATDDERLFSATKMH